jgi:DNA-binding MurR/RpiR family transcriptional regulator
LSGFNGLQNEFRKLIVNPVETYSSQVIEAMLRNTSSNYDEDNIFQSVVESEVQNALSTLDSDSSGRIRKVAGLMAKARRIRVLGLRQCYSLAHFLSYALHLLRDGVSPLGSSGHTLFENIPDLTSKDILIAISFKPYTRDVIDTCIAAHAAGAVIVVISDSYDAPLVHDHAFIVATRGPFFLSGMTAALVLSEALLLLTARALGQKALKRLHQMERLFESMHVEKR